MNMNGTGPPASGARRRSFSLSMDHGIPPLSGADNFSAANDLAALLECLICAADRHIIPAPAAAPDHPSITDALDALLIAAQDLEVIPGMSLADHLWTHAAPLQSGEVASTLIRRGRPRHPIPGFLLLYAVDARSPLLYLPQRQPLRVRDGIEIAHEAAGGSFLALIRCEAAADGRAHAVTACAIPIYHARRFVPVSASLDRDVLRALEHLQVALDAHGAECAIRRELPFFRTGPTRLTLSLSLPGRATREIHLGVAGDERSGHSAVSLPPIDFLVTLANWEDGTFIDWLGKTLP